MYTERTFWMDQREFLRKFDTKLVQQKITIATQITLFILLVLFLGVIKFYNRRYNKHGFRQPITLYNQKYEKVPFKEQSFQVAKGES